MDDWHEIEKNKSEELTEIKNMIKGQHEQMIKLCQLLSELQDKIKENNKKLNRLTSTIKIMEDKIIEKTERDVNKAIRSYYKGGESINFVPTRTPLSKLFED